MRKSNFCRFLFLCPALFVTVWGGRVLAAGLVASDGATGDYMGYPVSISGNVVVTGAYRDDIGIVVNQGSAYVFRGGIFGNGTFNQAVKLVASDGASEDGFGLYGLASTGTIAVVASIFDDVGSVVNQGSGYVFRNIHTATGTVNENLILRASDGAAEDSLGYGVSVNGTTALLTAPRHDVGLNFDQGAGYIFRNIHVGSGVKTEDLKLLASGGAPGDHMGFATSAALSSNIAVIGAILADVGSGTDQGAAFVFRGVDTATGTKFSDQRLQASDGATWDYFGVNVKLSGTTVIVGAHFDDIGLNADQGSVYVFRNIHVGTGNRTEDLKLIASDGGAFDEFGHGGDISGSNVLVGARRHNSDRGAAYLYQGVDSGTGTRTENVKIFASDTGGSFGNSVALDGDNFAIGSPEFSLATGKVYTGTVSSLTTLNAGNAYREIDQISFITRQDWIIGQTTSNNTVRLTAGDNATVTGTGNALRIGANSSSNGNTLIVDGVVSVTSGAWGVIVGNFTNSNNRLVVTGIVNAPAVHVGANATLGGNGAVNAANVVIVQWGRISPFNNNTGNQLATLTTGNLTLFGGSGYHFNLLTDGTGTAGTHWDRIAVNGTLNLGYASSSNPVILGLNTLSNSTTAGPLGTWNPNTYHVWQNIITTTGGLISFNSTKFSIDTANFANTINSSYAFRVRTVDGFNLDLEYYYVPEASAVVPALAVLLGAGFFARRRLIRQAEVKSVVSG